MSEPLFDRDLYVKRWEINKYFSNNTALDSLLSHMEKSVIARLQLLRNSFSSICIHSPQPLPILEKYFLKQDVDCSVIQYVNVDEKFPFDNKFDLVVVVNQWQWVNDLPESLQQYNRSLQKGGAILSAFVGEESFWQLRYALNQADIQCYQGVSPRISPFLTIQTTARLLQQATFAEPVCDRESLVLQHKCVMGLVRDIRGCYGRNAMKKRSLRPVSKKFLQSLVNFYPTTTTQGIETKLELIYALAWR